MQGIMIPAVPSPSGLSRRTFASAAAASLAGPLAGQGRERPNIVLLMADDFGYECVGANGGTSYRTPHLDRLARTGVRFTHGYAQPLCTPTRVQLMTGQHNFRNYQSFGTMAPSEKTFGHMMQRAGYKTAIAGKWQFYSYEAKGSPRYGIGQKPEQSGFDEYLLWHDLLTETKGSRYADPVINQNGKLRADTRGKYGPDLFAGFLGDFMERHRDQPFFAYYSMPLTHAPFNPTPRSADWAKGDRLKDDKKYFGDMVEYLDDEVGRLLARIDSLGIAGRTLVLFYADNGSPPEVTSRMGSRIIPGGKGKTIDSGMHVPLMARWSGVTPEGRVCSDLIDSTDFIPTMMEASGARWFDGRPLDGRSFLPQIRGQKGKPRDWAFAHYDPHPGCKVNFPPTRLAWDHRWKLYLDNRLYNIESDPAETAPVTATSGEPKAARDKLQAGLDQMARVQAVKFNKFATDGRAAY